MTIHTSPDTDACVPAPPSARGPLSAAVLEAIAADTASLAPLPVGEADAADPLGDDLQLALYVCYELHYRGFAGVDPDWEWAPELLRMRAALERPFLEALRAGVTGGDVEPALDALLVEDVDAYGVTHHLRDAGTWEQLREYLVHRSAYHLKEADPHAWVIPRLRGQAKAALVAVEFDEFGAGRGERVHARLFADMMRAVGLDDTYGHYLDRVPAVMLATVNLMSLFGLHRSLRGALVGHFAAAEISSTPGARRMAQAFTRLGAAEAAFFYTEHIEADAVHEQVMRRDVLADLLGQNPALAGDVTLGIQATDLLENRLGEHLLSSWRAGRSSLRPQP